MSELDFVYANLILLSQVGSTVAGLNVPGSDDRDELGVCIEPPEYVIGFKRIGFKRFESYVERTQPEGVRSGPGDLDRTIYSARQFCRLALKGNPAVMVLFYTEPEASDDIGRSLIELAPAFASKLAGVSFYGYMNRQRERLLGIRGRMGVQRPELVEKYSYDTKYAMHMLRLGYQGIEFLETGRLELPMPEPQRSLIVGVRTGSMTLVEVLDHARELEERLEDIMARPSNLPDLPDYDRVNEWLSEAYIKMWARCQSTLESSN